MKAALVLKGDVLGRWSKTKNKIETEEEMRTIFKKKKATMFLENGCGSKNRCLESELERRKVNREGRFLGQDIKTMNQQKALNQKKQPKTRKKSSENAGKQLFVLEHKAPNKDNKKNRKRERLGEVGPFGPPPHPKPSKTPPPQKKNP